MKTEIHKMSFYKKLSDIFWKYETYDHAIFLDSSLENETGRYSIVGLYPYFILKEENGIFYKNGRQEKGNLEDFLENYLKEHYEENFSKLPMISGAIGYFSYDYGRKFEQISSRHDKKIQMPEAVFVFYDCLLIEDQKEKTLYIAAKGEIMDPKQRILEMEQELYKIPLRESQKNSARKNAVYQSDFQKDEYKQAIERMIQYMEQGDIYVANMTQQLQVESLWKPYEAYEYLRYHNPSPFGGYFQYGDFQILSASPERFLKVKDGLAETRPIKGTRKRGMSAREDREMRRELEESSKDRSELLMIVDLERNDFNRVCVPGSVKVTKHFAVEAYATVFHLVSYIQGQLREECSAIDLIRSGFPGGSITGAPKIRAMEIIDELEHSARGLYTGSMGYFSLNGDCDFNIVIRTAVYQDGVYHLGVGGGITFESDTEFEYEETLQKAKAVLEALGEEIEG